MPPSTEALLTRVAGRMTGRVAVVTGSGDAGAGNIVGVGHAIAVVLAAAGAGVIVFDRDETAARYTVDRVEKLGGHAVAAIGDVTHGEDCSSAVRVAVSSFGHLDLVVNNAAILGRAASVDDDDEAFTHTLDVNVLGAVRMTRAALPHLGGGSAIVHISSLGATRSFDKLDYEASKGAINSMVNTMAIQFGHRGIRVNGVCPGQVWTAMGRRRLVGLGFTDAEIDAHRVERAEGVPLRSEGTAWDVASAVLFLAGDDARWITGHNLMVDGGQSGVVGYMPEVR